MKRVRRLWSRGAGRRVVDCPGAILIKSALRDLPFLSPVPHDEEPEPPSTGKQKPCRGLLNRALV